MVVKALNTNSIQTTKDGLNFDATNETWIIHPGVKVSSQSADGVSSNGFGNNVLINSGKISSSSAFGVFLGDGNATVVNNADGHISSRFGTAVGLLLGNTTVANRGTIKGTAGVGVSFGTGILQAKLLNYGSISGGQDALKMLSHHVGGTIANHHTITSAHGRPIYIDTGPSLVTHITNAAGAVISAATSAKDAIYAKDGGFKLINHGTITGKIDDHDNANDIIINRGSIDGKVLLGTGNDTFNGKGGTSGAIVAAGGNDTITAGNGNVSITVGYGNDSITGGPGHDRFIFNSPIAGQVETITNFKPGLDKIVFSETDFFGLGPPGVLSAAHFHLNTAVNGHAQIDYFGTGFLEYCPNGNAGPAYIFAVLSNHAIVSASDFVVHA
jgi:Ca2+-binding RTX toxin-like protein